MGFDAVVLAGGRAARLGGRDKALVEVGGRTLLDRSLEAVSGARRVVVVGPRRPTSYDVVWTVEDPAGAGPVHGLAAGLEQVSAERVVVVAVDLPFVEATTIERLIAAIGLRDGAALTDPEGRLQPLAAAYNSAALRRALTSLATTEGAAMKEVTARLDLVEVADAAASADVDDEADLAAARARLES